MQHLKDIIRASVHRYKNITTEYSEENKDKNYNNEVDNSIMETHFIEQLSLWIKQVTSYMSNKYMLTWRTNL